MGTYICPCRNYGIFSGSDHKQEAWEVLRVLTGNEDYKYISSADEAMPVSKEEFERMLKRFSATEEYVDEDGETIEPYTTSSSQAGLRVSLEPLTADDVKLLRKLIKNSGVCWMNDDNLYPCLLLFGYSLP